MFTRHVVRSQGGAGRPRLFAAAMACLALAAATLGTGTAPALAQESLGADSKHGGHAPIEEHNMANPEPGLIVPEAKKAEWPPFIADTKLGAQLRTYYLNRDKFDPSRSEAWAIGGSISYLSGYLFDFFRIGAVGYTSQPLYAPDEYDGTGLLKPGQEGYTVLGQAYGEFKLTDRVFAAFGRKTYNTPYINDYDVRMTPYTFQGGAVYGTAGGEAGAPLWRFGGGYVSKMKDWTSTDFVSMSQIAGAPAGIDRGVYAAGATFVHKNFSLSLWEYYSDDIINIIYSEGKYTLPGTQGYKLSFGAQYSDQRSTGDDLLMGSEFSTNQWGVRSDLGFASATLTLAYTSTANGSTMRSPWSGYPGYTSVQVEDFNRAGENAWMFKAAYDFSHLGAQGLTAYALAVLGSGVQAPNFNENEYDFNIEWKPKEGLLKNSSWRVRYARITQRAPGDPAFNDFRVIVNFDF